MPRMSPPPTFKPDKRSACLCGSGKLFQHCCAAIYNKKRPLSESQDALSQRRYGLALRLARADITRYTIWHKSHTEPMLPTSNPHLLLILTTDIEALAGLVDILMHCYRYTKQWDRLPAVLDRLEPNIQDSRWQHKIILFRAVQAMGVDWDNRDGARRELARLPPIGEIEDVDILTFYLDVNGDELTLKENLDLADRVIELTADPGVAFSYGVLKGFYSAVLGEFRDAERQISVCIEQLRTTDSGSLYPFIENRLAQALAMAASIRLFFEDEDRQAHRYLGEARYLYNKLLRECDFTALGRAAAYRGMADTYWFQADWRSARHYYDLALVEYGQTNDIYKILSAKCDIQLGETESARHKLGEVDETKLDQGEYADYAFQFAALALKSADAEDGVLAQRYLEKVEPRWPYFREAKHRYEIALLSPKGSKERKEAGRLIRLLSGVLRYATIRPGAFGVNLDVNKMIEDTIAKMEDKRRLKK